ncbi:MAG: Yip1 family protein [Bacillota bacterium]
MGEGVFDWLYGVITRPVEALRAVAERKPVGWALVIVIGAWVLSLAAGLSQADFSVLERVGFEDALSSALGVLVTLGIILAAVVYLAGLAILHLSARLFGGKGTFAALFCALGFAEFPMVLSVPLAVLGRIGGPGIDALSSVASLGLTLWVVVLSVIALREAHKLPTGTAIGAYVLAIVVPFVALAGLVFLMIMLIATLGAAFSTM